MDALAAMRVQLSRMTVVAGRSDTGWTVVPLFAHNAHVWLRVWAAMQAIALAITVFTAMDAAVNLPRIFAMLVLLTLYHVVGVRSHDWIMRRTWAILVFVPLGWVLVISAMGLNAGFGLLIFGAILQGFIFLPFSWAIAVLACITLAVTTLIASRAPWKTPSMALARVGWIPAIGVMIGTVLLYIHRSNRDADIRTQLLRKLDSAQHDLADRAREAGAQEERQRFARDIHDTLAQGFSSVIKHLETIELTMAAGEGNTAELRQKILTHLGHAQNVSRASLGDIRRLVWALQPAELSEETLTPALARIVAQWGTASDVAASFKSEALPILHPDADVALLRALQESLSNVAKHAEARRVQVSLACVEDLLLLTVEDDGVGFTEPDDGGMGLAGMRERARRFGGRVLIESVDGGGTSLTVALPLSTVAAHTGDEG